VTAGIDRLIRRPAAGWAGVGGEQPQRKWDEEGPRRRHGRRNLRGYGSWGSISSCVDPWAGVPKNLRGARARGAGIAVPPYLFGDPQALAMANNSRVLPKPGKLPASPNVPSCPAHYFRDGLVKCHAPIAAILFLPFPALREEGRGREGLRFPKNPSPTIPLPQKPGEGTKPEKSSSTA